MDVHQVLGSNVRPLRERKPPWFKVPAPGGPRYRELTELIRSENLHTVCQEAACPNVGECWERGTATFMILGDTCTRRCGFCNVRTGKPTWNDPLEPARVARSIARMGLRHAVITSVDRDDLPDRGAGQFAATIKALEELAPGASVEVLTPDFVGFEEEALALVLAEQPAVFNHNIETVRRLHRKMRGAKASYDGSLQLLARAREIAGYPLVTKSGLMVGLGETNEEVAETLGDLRRHGVEIVTIGQYLQPTSRHATIERWVHPDEFRSFSELGRELGFRSVFAGPLVRSSYRADEQLRG
jgi:lipoic acid synthetase